MFMGIQLYLVRHGETEENVANILQGHLPGHLTKRGREQARHLRDELASIPFDALVCSDLLRCRDTADIVNEAHGLPVQPTPLLRERDWGIHTGQSIRSLSGGIDASAESVDALFTRARRFLRALLEQHDGQTVLAVGHGLFNRVIQGALAGCSIREIPRMNNAEVRCITVAAPLPFADVTEESGFSAD